MHLHFIFLDAPRIYILCIALFKSIIQYMNWQHLWDFIVYMFVEPILANPLIVRTQFIKYIYIFFWCYNSTFFIVEWN